MHFNKTSPANTVDLSLSLESFFVDEPNGLIGVGEGEKNSKHAKFFQYSYVYFVMKGSVRRRNRSKNCRCTDFLPDSMSVQGSEKRFWKSPMIPFSKTEWEALTSDVQDV